MSDDGTRTEIECRSCWIGISYVQDRSECVNFCCDANDLERKASAFRRIGWLWTRNAEAFRSTV